MITAKQHGITRKRVDFCDKCMLKYVYPISGIGNIFLERYTHNESHNLICLYNKGSELEKGLTS